LLELEFLQEPARGNGGELKVNNQHSRKGVLAEHKIEVLLSVILLLASTFIAYIGHTRLGPDPSLMLNFFLALLNLLFIFSIFQHHRITDLSGKAMRSFIADYEKRYSDLVEDVKKKFEQIDKRLPPTQFVGLNEMASSFIKLKTHEGRDCAENLASRGRFPLEKRGMYKCLEELTHSVQKERGDQVFAVSSRDIEAYIKDPYAKSYLYANAEAVKQGILIQRIFVLNRTHLMSRDSLEIVKEHESALKKDENEESDTLRSGVKWVASDDIPDFYRDEDFALFKIGDKDEGIVIRQRGASAREQYEGIQDSMEFKEALRTFEFVWKHGEAKDPAELVAHFDKLKAQK